MKQTSESSPKKRSITVLLMSLFALLLPCSSLADEHDLLIKPNRNFVLSAHETRLIKSLAPLKVMIDDNFVPLSHYDNKTGSYQGISVDLFRHMADKLGLKYELQHNPKLSWSDKVDLFNKREVDLLMPVSITAERGKSGIFTASFYDAYYGVIGNKSRDIIIKSSTDLSKHRVGVTKAAAIIPFIQTFVPSSQIILYDNQADLYKALSNGQVDVALQNKNVFREDRFNMGYIDLSVQHTILESPRRYTFYLYKTETLQNLTAIIDRYLAGTDYSGLVSHYEQGDDELILRYTEQKQQKKLLLIGIVCAMLLLTTVGVSNQKHRRLSVELTKSLKQAQQTEEVLLALKNRLQEQNNALQENKQNLHDKNDELLATEEMLRVQIDEFVTSQKLLKDSEERFRTLHNASFGGIMIHEKGLISDCNQGLSDMTGFTIKELVGMDSLNLIAPDWRALVVKNIEHGVDQRYEAKGVRKDGTEYFLAIRGKNIPYQGGTVRIKEFRDITESKVAENRIQKERDFSQAALDSLPGLFYMFDEQGHFLRWNQNFEKVSGYASEEIPELTPLAFFDGPDQESITNAIKNCFATGEVVVEAVFLSKNQIKTPCLFTGKLFHFDQKPCLIGMGIDISERQRAEEEKKALEQQFHHAQKLDSLGVLAGGIAHDFNNILTVILNHCFMARENLIREQEYKAVFHKIETAGNRAADLCRQMLTYAGKSPMEKMQVNLWLLVDEVVKMLQAAIKKNVTIELDLKRVVPEIKGDTGQIQQIIMNLIINAAEAIGDNNGTIRVALTRILVKVDQTETDVFGTVIQPGGYICLDVSDNGCGMDEETQKRIFEPFFTTKFTGRGLGMSAIHGIVKSHDGALQLTSTPGVGTTFKVFFPVPAASDYARTDPITTALAEEASGTILLVEDDGTLRVMGEALLEAIGFNTLTAQNGLEALEIYRERGCEIDLILLDLVMPKLGGIETYQELRKISPTVPIIICSGYGVDSVAYFINNDLHTGFVHKPYKPEVLRDVMMRMMTVKGEG